ncbi:hypothetical protein H9L39_17389 [Fusarium oxysporum f. sp. albedinis]|nr:hypothetical protein H9L39_17389 [Fusarium oxysporum f. sp. albedinis]
MTDDDRPFTRDFKDLLSTLVVSFLPLSAHHVRLTQAEYTFISEDAINNLGSLKFSQSNRMPDPEDPSRIVTTATTTTFSMAKDMARPICQRFVDARFVESADGKYQQVYNMKGSVWQLTPKGITVLDRFCSRNGIQQKQGSELVNLGATKLVLLERDSRSDKLPHDQGTLEATVNAADSDSLHDYKNGLIGVTMAAERKVNGNMYRDTFTGKATTDWLMDCCTIVDKRETVEINPGCNVFQPTEHAIYQISQRGKDLINGSGSRGRLLRPGDQQPARQKIRHLMLRCTPTNVTSILRELGNHVFDLTHLETGPLISGVMRIVPCAPAYISTGTTWRISRPSVLTCDTRDQNGVLMDSDLGLIVRPQLRNYEVDLGE